MVERSEYAAAQREAIAVEKPGLSEAYSTGEVSVGTLVEGVIRGERQAYEALAGRYLRAAYSVALGIVRRPSDAEDVAQNAMIRAFERIETCRNPERFSGWLMQIVRNQARNWLQSRKLRDVQGSESTKEVADTGRSPEQGVVAGDLLQALETLSEAQREVVLLHDLEGWTHFEISKTMDISVVMSRQHLFQARKKLRKILAQADPPGEAKNGRQ